MILSVFEGFLRLKVTLGRMNVLQGTLLVGVAIILGVAVGVVDVNDLCLLNKGLSSTSCLSATNEEGVSIETPSSS